MDIRVDDRLPNSRHRVFAVVKDRQGRRYRIIAEYVRENELELDDYCEWGEGCTVGEDGTEYCSPGWYESNQFEDVHYKVDGEVTHWQELPPLPETEES